MGDFNRATLIGNLTADPEGRDLATGRLVMLNLATGERWTDKAGQKQERTQYHRIVIYNDRLGQFAEKYLRKGSKVCVEGAIQTRKYTDKQGAERFITEIVLAQYRGEIVSLDDPRGQQTQPQYTPAAAPRPLTPPRPVAPLDDEIPF